MVGYHERRMDRFVVPPRDDARPYFPTDFTNSTCKGIVGPEALCNGGGTRQKAERLREKHPSVNPGHALALPASKIKFASLNCPTRKELPQRVRKKLKPDQDHVEQKPCSFSTGPYSGIP